MSEFREQAIRDVAEACRFSGDYIRLSLEFPPVDVADKRIAYAVSRQERVLELEAELAHWRGCGWAQTSFNTLAEPEREKTK